ncbi:ABC transporter permease subunit [Acholeplasma sp. OttesenSCG-928-E16]|nr:ABC transporter permease subunit [Acholeplasma sp. OttesenSCG-928-E16]
MKKTIITTTSIFFIFLVWIIIHLAVSNPLLFPNPIEVIKAFFSIFTKENSYISIGLTFLRLLVSLASAFLLGTICGLLSAKIEGFRTFFKPIVTIFRTIPVISIIVIALIVFGFNGTPYVISFLTIFPLVYQQIQDSILSIDHTYLDIYKLEDNGIIKGFFYCYLPLIRRSIFTTILQCLGLGIKVIVMAEYVSQIKHGIGKEIYQAGVSLRYDLVFAWTSLLVMVALTFELVTFKVQKNIE